MKIFMSGILIVAAAVLPGCHRHHHHPGPGPDIPPHRPAGHVHPRFGHPEWVHDARHVHSHNCGHYHHNGRWYVHDGHIHRDGCGHHLRGGIWIVID